jgi:hypothetical protein
LYGAGSAAQRNYSTLAKTDNKKPERIWNASPAEAICTGTYVRAFPFNLFNRNKIDDH